MEQSSFTKLTNPIHIPQCGKGPLLYRREERFFHGQLISVWSTTRRWDVDKCPYIFRYPHDDDRQVPNLAEYEGGSKDVKACDTYDEEEFCSNCVRFDTHTTRPVTTVHRCRGHPM